MKKHRFPPMLADVVMSALTACEGVLFDKSSSCPACNGAATGYDIRQKPFAFILDEDHKRTITIRVKRFSCRNCGTVFFADQPFYPGTRIGSPVVDLSSAFSGIMPCSRATSMLMQMGVIVDRWSIRNYTGKVQDPATMDMFGVRLPASIVSLSALAAGTGDGETLDPADILAACSYPSRHTGGLSIEE